MRMKSIKFKVFGRKSGAVILGLIALLIVAASASAINLSVVATSSAGGGNINWGLKQNKNETVPQVSAKGAELLKTYNGRYIGDPEKKTVYFTYDLGYEAGYTGALLDVLNEQKIKAVFFLTGNYLEKENDLVSRMINEGHYLGNHTNKHKNLTKLDAEGVRADIMELETIMLEKYKVKPVFFRPPEGSFNERVLGITNGAGYTTLLWSGAYVDWNRDKEYGADFVKEKVLEMVHPGAIYLFHVCSSDPPSALPGIISGLSEKGYTIGDPGELIIKR